MKKQLKKIILFLLVIFSQCKIQEVNLSNENERNLNFTDLLSKPKHNLRTLEDETINFASEPEDKCLNRPLYESPNSMYFFPVLKAKLISVGDQIEFPSRCFGKNVATLTELSKSQTIIKIESSMKYKERFCLQVFLIHTININTMSSPLDEGVSEIKLTHLTDDDLDEIRLNGIKIFGFCNGLINSIISLVKTGLSSLSGFGMDPDNINPILRPYMKEGIQLNELFKAFKLYNNYEPRKRRAGTIKIDPTAIHTGDVISIIHYGYDSNIAIMTGGRSTHSAVFGWIDGELYVLESMEAAYWPEKGFQMRKYDEWIKLAENAGFDVAILQLSSRIRDHFDEKKAIEWFKSKLDLPFGKKNIFFAHIDTKDQNLPYSMQHEHLEFIFSVLEKIDKNIANIFVLEALNLRVGTKNLSFSQVAAEASRKLNKSIEELFAMPELDDYIYSNGENYCCSAMVIEFFRQGGLFKGLDILPREFTPKDLYELDFYEKDPSKRMQQCIDADPDLSYCQWTGRFKMDLPYFSSVEPYSHMNERCATIPPDFKRPDKC